MVTDIYNKKKLKMDLSLNNFYLSLYINLYILRGLRKLVVTSKEM